MRAQIYLQILIVISLIAIQASCYVESDLLQCPKITCSESLGDNVCFMHSGTNPVDWIKLANCPTGYQCDATQEFAWYDQVKQPLLGTTEHDKSPSWKKLVESKCEKAAKFRQNLLPGRYCESPYECLSFNCTDSKCKGLASGKACSSHAQCDIGMGCLPKTDFPYLTQCDTFKKTGEACDNSFDCSVDAVCWYQSRADFYSRSKKCLTKYALAVNATFGWSPYYYDNVKDIVWNGQVCSTGIAIPVYDTSTAIRPIGKCVNITKMVTDQKTYSNFYTGVPKCIAANRGSYCTYYYDTTNSFKTRCYCGADGTIGYCPLANMQAQQNLSTYESAVLGNATNCHTMDRDNFKAHLECGIGSGTPLQYFIQAKTIRDHWPFVQDDSVKDCLVNYMPHSYANILTTQALIIGISKAFLALALSISTFFILF